MTRFFDILFSLLAVIVLTSFMIPIMIGLKLTGEHDIFYRQERIGKGGNSFNLLKFALCLGTALIWPADSTRQKMITGYFLWGDSCAKPKSTNCHSSLIYSRVI